MPPGKPHGARMTLTFVVARAHTPSLAKDGAFFPFSLSPPDTTGKGGMGGHPWQLARFVGDVGSDGWGAPSPGACSRGC